MDKALKIAVILSAVDNMSRIIDQSVSKSQAKLKSLTESMNRDFRRGTASIAAGTAIAASMAPAVSAFAELEQSSTRLETSMMKVGGVTDKAFKPVNELAIQLGSQLPGTTADFNNLFVSMLNGGVKAQSILDGVGKSAAYLAVALEMPYAEAGKFAAKMKEATGTADADFMSLMDTLARTKQAGVDVGEMQYAFGRSAGALKLMGIQGLEASKSMTVLYASLIRSGLSGETVGTGFASILNNILNPDKMGKAQAAAREFGVSLDFMKNGKFGGVENMIAQLDKLRGLSATDRAGVVNALTGGGQDAQMLQSLITNGLTGFNALKASMNEQASLQQKVDKQLGTLTNTWEAATGNFTNMMAVFGSSLAPMLKELAEGFGKVTTAVGEFASENPKLFAVIGTIMALAAGTLILGGIVFYMHGAWTAAKAGLLLFSNTTKIATGVQWLFNAALWANPITWIVIGVLALIAAVAILVWKWKEITSAMDRSTGIMRVVYTALRVIFAPLMAIAWAIRKVIDNWDDIVAFFDGIVKKVQELPAKLFEAGANIVNSLKNGIESKWGEFKAWWGDKIQGIRDFLPFSPAKVGPLKDIHRLKFVETIASSIKPGPMVKAVRGVTAAAALALTSPAAGSVSMGGGAAAAGGSITINVPVTIQPGGTGNPTEIASAVKAMAPEIMREIERLMQRKQSRQF